MRIAIAGAGAMGGRFGDMLSHDNQEVILIDRWEANLKAINTRGLIVNVSGTEHVDQIVAVQPAQVDPSEHFDLVIMFTKAMQLDAMLTDIKPILHDDTMVLTLANGIGNVETIEKYVPKENIIAGVTTWSAGLDSAGYISYGGEGIVQMQAVETGKANQVDQIVEVMNSAGLNVTLTDDAIEAIWRKAALNAVLNPLCTLLNCNIGNLGKTTTFSAMMDEILAEFQQVADAMHVPFDVTKTRNLILAQLPDEANGTHYPSMHQDMLSKRPTEIDYLNGYVARQGESRHIPTMVNRLITQEIHAMEQLVQGNH
ncbi:2-dehydropantoate 2-reductase [Levilactobacillus bambusae]|uniref:2-dehydropantoate 2-reductase n=1 Tax=Levilactobacillus bambusae TaxID=2024736 RepID=A0A2V1MZ45_9LACO|nr:2-dehydropantoate 2-reductase [Levilactobacillus bambusae]PWG00284.1 2-dehydropantoate 2-reductase [Levilactobacillus bambusae]